jgi:hypothetical protein
LSYLLTETVIPGGLPMLVQLDRRGGYPRLIVARNSPFFMLFPLGRFFMSPRFKTLKAIRAEIRPEPLPPPAKSSAPARATASRRRRYGLPRAGEISPAHLRARSLMKMFGKGP